MLGRVHEDLETLKTLLPKLNPEAEEAIGLLLNLEGRYPAYDATPPGAEPFACTGGDGVHFSFLPNEQWEPSNWPVVMTVPMQFDRPNLVVGSSLREFLALGIRVGYFVLEQLVYSEQEMIAALDHQQFPHDASPQLAFVLRSIAATFSLEPWDDHGQRLAWLNSNIPLPVEN